MSQAQFTVPLIFQSDGNTIFASEAMAELTNIATNLNPTGIGGYQDSLAQKQLQEDPATGLAASLAKDIEQLRFALKRAIGETYWYTAPDTDLANALAGPASATDNALVRFDGTSGKISQNSLITVADDGDTVIGDGSKTTTTPFLTLNSDTGDAGIRLQVNNTSANAWDIYNDNSDSDQLKLDYNGTTYARFSATGGLSVQADNASEVAITAYQISTGDAAIRLRVNNTPNNEWAIINDNSNDDTLTLQYGGNTKFQFDDDGSDAIVFSANAISTATAPLANTLYPHSMVKAWGSITGNGTASPTVNDSFNIDTVSATTTYVQVDFHTPMANADYAVSITGRSSVGVAVFAGLDIKTTTYFRFRLNSVSDGAAVDPTGGTVWYGEVFVIGRQ